jgi:hypothetical protein
VKIKLDENLPDRLVAVLTELGTMSIRFTPSS